MARKTPNTTTQALIKSSNRSCFLRLSDEDVTLKKILETHIWDGQPYDLGPLFAQVEDTLNRSTIQVDIITSGMHSQVKQELEEKVSQMNSFSGREFLKIDEILCEITCKTLAGLEGNQATVLDIFKSVSDYSWEAKLVLTLAAFALYYGDFCLLSQIYMSNQLAKSLATLRQLSSILEHTARLKSRFDKHNSLIRLMLDVTRCVLAFNDLPSTHISQDVPALAAANALIPTTVYRTIKSAVACASQITILPTMSHEQFLTEGYDWDHFSELDHNLRIVYEHLKKLLEECQRHIADRMDIETYKILVKLLDATHIDNMKFIKRLIYAKDDIQPLVDGASKRQVNIEVLRRKNVLLLISGLDIPQEELSILAQIYNESRNHLTMLETYEVVWIPIVEQWSDELQTKFETVQASMPWYTVHHPTLIQKPVIRFIKEKWHFSSGSKPILVVLDPQGRVASPNAIHMMWIWGNAAFPFTTRREEDLWNTHTWSPELLLGSIDDTLILNWMREGKYFFLYGGDDVEWIRKFTRAARDVAQASEIPVEMLYVGKSTKRDHMIARVMEIVAREKLGHCWKDDPTMVGNFWTRIESMMLSPYQLGEIVREIKKLYSYAREGGWALLCKGSSNVVLTGHGTKVLLALLEYEFWKENVAVKGLGGAFKDYYEKLHDDDPSCCLCDKPRGNGRLQSDELKCPECHRILEKYDDPSCCLCHKPRGNRRLQSDELKCPECHRILEKYTAFLCCHDQHVNPAPPS